MDAQTIIAKRIAQELRSGMLVNLGIGIPTIVANYLPADMRVFFQSENGLIGTGPLPEEGMATGRDVRTRQGEHGGKVLDCARGEGIDRPLKVGGLDLGVHHHNIPDP